MEAVGDYYLNNKTLGKGEMKMEAAMKMRIADIGDEIVSNKGIKGKVEMVKENSVIIEILENLSDREYVNNRTVVSHKNYVII
ncbi:DUF2187 family protein [Mesobacillus campisalis]|jgi:uncharacterized protein YkvS|nr:DUF2187 family protein [Mesobacillus campisalis]